MEKKDSIFSGLNPAPPPAPAAQRPSASEAEITALRQKIESLEKRLKSSEPEGGQPVLSRIGDLEKKLEEFGRSIMMSSAQMKHIEESKAGARRETEELLKVVREQQKYSEMDRQMHDQAEKAWARVEDLEKKLLDFYATAINRPAEDARQARQALQPEDVERIVDARLREMMGELDLKFRALLSKLEEAAPAGRDEAAEAGLLSALDARLASANADLKSAVDARLASSGTDLKSAVDDRLSAFGGDLKSAVDARLAAFSADLKAGLDARLAASESDMRTGLRAVLREEEDALRKSVSGYLAESESRLGAVSKLISDQLNGVAELELRHGDALAKLDAALRENTDRSRAAAAALAEDLAAMFRRHASAIEDRLQAENAKLAGEIAELSRQSSFSLGTATVLAANMDEMGGSLGRLKSSLKTFVDGMSSVSLGSVLGVTGQLARKNLEGLQSTLKGLEHDLAVFERLKTEIGGHLKGMADKAGGRGV